ncbi:hypothetical protein QQ045_009865 [Rhodiola kirilowii]
MQIHVWLTHMIYAQVIEMIPSSTEIEQPATKRLEESSTPNGNSKFGNNKSTVVSSSRQWSAFRNPRIVRVSRSFGGKDRHSKVCTVRGLRDRRIRLSVPTAIQLYDLQERLGLSQPSKVIDWLIENTKEDIDKLPPLQLPQGSFGQFLQQSIMGGAASHNDQIADQNMMSNSNNLPVYFDRGNSGLFSRKYRPEIMEERSKYWDYLDAASKAKSKEVERDNIEVNQVEKAKTWMEMSNHFQGLRGYNNINNNNNNQVSAQNFFPVASDDPYNQSWDTTSTPRLAAGSNNDHSNCNLLSAASSSTFGALIPSGGPQLFFCPPPSTSTTVFPVTTTYPPYPYSTTSVEADPGQVNSHFHLFSPSSSIKTFQLNNKNPKHLQSHSQGEDNSSS